MKNKIITILLVLCVLCVLPFAFSVNKNTEAADYTEYKIMNIFVHNSNGNVFLNISERGGDNSILNLDSVLGSGGLELKMLRDGEEITVKLNSNGQNPYITGQKEYLNGLTGTVRSATYVIADGTILGDSYKFYKGMTFKVSYDTSKETWQDGCGCMSLEKIVSLDESKYVDTYDLITVRDLVSNPGEDGVLNLEKYAKDWTNVNIKTSETNITKSYVFRFINEYTYKDSVSGAPNTQSYIRLKFVNDSSLSYVGCSVLPVWGDGSVHDQTISGTIYNYSSVIDNYTTGNKALIEIGCLAEKENPQNYVYYFKINGRYMAYDLVENNVCADSSVIRFLTETATLKEWIIRDYDYYDKEHEESGEQGLVSYDGLSLNFLDIAGKSFQTNRYGLFGTDSVNEYELELGARNPGEKIKIGLYDSIDATKYGRLSINMNVGSFPGEAGVGETFAEGATEVINIYNENNEKVYSESFDLPDTGFNYVHTFSFDPKDLGENCSYFYIERENYKSQLFIESIKFYKTYTVSFDGNETKVCYGEKAVKPEDPVKESDNQYDYTFSKWTLDGEEYDFETPVTKDISLVSTYTTSTRTYKINFDEGVKQQKLAYGECGVKPEDPEKEGYTFAAWMIGESEYDFATPVTQDITLTAKWNINNYTLTISRSDGSNETVSFNAENRAEVLGKVSLTADNDQYTYSWKEALPENLSLKDVTIEEIRTLKKYIVSFSDGIASQEVEYGKKAEKPEDPAKKSTAQYEYVFAGWELDGNVFSFDTEITGNISLTSKFEEKTRKYVVSFSDGVASQEVEYGKKAEKPEDPVKESDGTYDYVFKGWYLGNAEFDFETAVTGNITLTAEFEQKEAKKSGCNGSVGVVSCVTLLGLAFVLTKKRR